MLQLLSVKAHLAQRSAVGDFGMVLLQFLLTVAVAAIMYAQGERALAGFVRFGQRLAGAREQQSVVLAAQAEGGTGVLDSNLDTRFVTRKGG